MADTATGAESGDALATRRLRMWLLAFCGAGVIIELLLVFRININWDEFNYLLKVHEHLRGELSNTLQTFHVHLFPWLRLVSVNEANQIVAARLVVSVTRLLSLGLTYLIARRFVSRTASLFAVLCYVSFGFIVEHGTSFRSDPFATLLFLAAVYAVLRWRRSGALVAGALLALALLFTIKASIHVVTLGAFLALYMDGRESTGLKAKRLTAFAAGLLATFIPMYALHRLSLADPSSISPLQTAGSAASRLIRVDEVFPAAPFLLRSLQEDLLIWLLLLAGMMIVAIVRNDRVEASPRIALLAFLLPVVTLVLYRNAFPYYYVFIMSPAVVLCGVAFDMARDLARRSHWRHVYPMAIAVLVAGGGTAHAVRAAGHGMAEQRQLIAAVHDLFPEPVPYLDRTAMVASYPKVGFFMTSWGMEVYQEGGVPTFRNLLVTRSPQFLIVNSIALEPGASPEKVRAMGGIPLLAEDRAAIRQNFVRHWGPLYVPGKELHFPEDTGDLRFEILIAGTYTLEAEAPLVINRQPVAPGASFHLDRGFHLASSPHSGFSRATLRWGNNLAVPSFALSEQPLFVGF